MSPIVLVIVLICVYFILIGFFLSNTYLAAKTVTFFPFFMFILAFIFLLIFASNDDTLIKWITGCMIIVCGFTCTKDFKALRHKLGREEYL